MDRTIHVLTYDGTVRGVFSSSRGMVERARRVHGLSPVATAALGRALTAVSMMASGLKIEGSSTTLQIKGGGPLGTILAVGEPDGAARGFLQNPLVELPLKPDGKLDVGTAVGREGVLGVIRDSGRGEPYSGQIPLVSGEIAEDVTSYFVVSEQIPTVCALGVLVDVDRTVRAAGGFLIQLMPGAGETEIEKLEENLKDFPAVTALLDGGMELEEIARRALAGLNPEILEEHPISYRCSCSRQKVERAILSLGAGEIAKIAQDEKTEVSCQFCDKIYEFSRGEIERLAGL